MSNYFFTAKSQEGKAYSGAKEARNEQELARILRQEGYILISAVSEDLKNKERSRPWQKTFLFWDKVSLKDKIIFVRSLRVMVSAGVSLPKALNSLALQSKNKKFKKALIEISEEIIRGKNFSGALEKYPDIFSEFFQSMVKVGEEAGTLEQNLGILAQQMERENALKSKIKETMVYPSVIVAAMTGIGIMMLIVVVPKLSRTFQELELELPLTTKIVIGLGAFITERWYLAVLILIVFIFLFQIIFKIKKGKKTLDGLFLRTPIICQLIRKINAAHTVRTLGSLIAAGVPLVRSLEIVADTLGNYYFKEAIAQSIAKVEKGEKLSQALKPYQNLYPLAVVQMIEVGEETGQTSEVLEKLGDFFEEEVASATKNLTAIIEPVLMLIIGSIVGFFAVSMVQPMYSMLSGLQ